MTTTKADLEAYAQNKHAVKITPQLLTAYILDKTGWTFAELRATPDHIVNELQHYWHLQDVAQDAATKDARKGQKGK